MLLPIPTDLVPIFVLLVGALLGCACCALGRKALVGPIVAAAALVALLGLLAAVSPSPPVWLAIGDVAAPPAGRALAGALVLALLSLAALDVVVAARGREWGLAMAALGTSGAVGALM